VLRLWRQDAEFRTFFIELLKNSPYTAFRWETPPITKANSDQPFEFVMLDSPGLVCKPDTLSFAEHFHTAMPGSIIEFSNLGGDAVMVVPCPTDPMTDYSHIAAFLRNAPESAQHQLWQSVAEAMLRRLGSKPVWLSTAGGGVAWLHVRLDSYPKYYGYQPYRHDVYIDAGLINSRKLYET